VTGTEEKTKQEETAPMIRQTLTALSVAAILGLGLASTASAKTHVNFDINLGFGGYAEPYPAYPVADDYDDDPGCGWVWVKRKVWNASHTHKIWIKRKQWVCG
jgi:hypothetical protein